MKNLKDKTPDIEDLWEEDLRSRYPENGDKGEEDFRDYTDPARDTVREFYRMNHLYQNYDFVLQKKAEYTKLEKRKMGLWEAVEFLNTLVDDSDPDTDLDQTQHLLQTSEAIRADGHPDWFILTGFLHDLGKVLCLFGEPQWAVVGDTFPVGCFPNPLFTPNSSRKIPIFTTKISTLNMGFMSRIAVSIRSSFHGAMTSIYTTFSRNIYLSLPCI